MSRRCLVFLAVFGLSVLEWCADSRLQYEDKAVVDPAGSEGAWRAVRGGS